GLPQRAIGDSAWRYQQQVEAGDTVVVGVNRFTSDEPPPVIETPDFGALATEQIARLTAVRRQRDQAAVTTALAAIRHAADGTEPLMPPIVSAVRARATLGEISDVLREA